MLGAANGVSGGTVEVPAPGTFLSGPLATHGRARCQIGAGTTLDLLPDGQPSQEPVNHCPSSAIRKLTRPTLLPMKIGTTTFGFRYSFMDPTNSPKLAEVVRQARDAGVERLQVCENTRPLDMSRAEWQEARRCASDLGVEIQLGCKTLRPEMVERYLRLAQELSCNQLRIVLEEPPEYATRESVARLLEAVVPRMQALGMRLAVENHFDLAAALLLELASTYPPEVVGFCVDTANSLRRIEAPLQVISLLRKHACCYHLKDYRIVGTLIGFSVAGAPLGEGDLDFAGCLRLIFESRPVPPLFVETWTPTVDHREQDIAREADWLRRSVRNLRSQLEGYE